MPSRREVRLLVPVNTQYIRVARLAAAALAVPAGFGIDDAEDLRIAVDELCSTLVEAGEPDAHVELVFLVSDGEIAVHGRAPSAGALEIDTARRQLGFEILAAVAAEHELAYDGIMLDYRLVFRRRGLRAGGL